MTDVSRETPPPPAVAAEVFSSRLPLLERYAAALAGVGVARGLIGPREVPRLWERHLLNCGLVAAVPVTGSVADVGTGAGLPGLVWALTRPDLQVTLIEPLLRRTVFLQEMIDDFDLAPRVRVLRGRAEAFHRTERFEVVTARALAPLERLVQWCLPLVAPGGRLLALKGSAAHAEVVSAAGMVDRYGGTNVQVRSYGVGLVAEPTTVIQIDKAR